jgi:hypothetical protein
MAVPAVSATPFKKSRRVIFAPMPNARFRWLDSSDNDPSGEAVYHSIVGCGVALGQAV